MLLSPSPPPERRLGVQGKRSEKDKASKAAADKVAAQAAALQAVKKAERRIETEEARKKFTRIDAFEGIYDFLSLDHVCPTAWDGRVFPSARFALLAAQFPRAAPAVAEAQNLEEAKRAISDEQEADEWSKNRLKEMEKILRDKFRRSDDMRKRLKETGERDLVWENDDDLYWGVVNGKGQNQLGRVLMEVRKSIEDNTEFETWLIMVGEIESESVKRPPIELVEKKGDETEVHKLAGQPYFKMGKLPKSAVVALHPSVSREHAMIIHSRAYAARKFGGIAILDLGSKAGVEVNGIRLRHPYLLEALKNGDTIRLGASTRQYEVRMNLKDQIQQLEQQSRELMREVHAIEGDAADPIRAAKRAAKEEATVFVGNLEYETEKADLLRLFQDCGRIDEVRFPGHIEGGKATRGIAFVTFDNTIASRRACGLNGELFKGRKIKVAPATEGRREEKGKGKGKGKDEDDDWDPLPPRRPPKEDSRSLAARPKDDSRSLAARDRRGERSRSREPPRRRRPKSESDEDLEVEREKENGRKRKGRDPSPAKKSPPRRPQADSDEDLDVEREKENGGKRKGRDPSPAKRPPPRRPKSDSDMDLDVEREKVRGRKQKGREPSPAKKSPPPTASEDGSEKEEGECSDSDSSSEPKAKKRKKEKAKKEKRVKKEKKEKKGKKR